MESMTLSKIELQRNKVAAALDRARRSHGTIGRGGGVVDASSLVARLERELSDWTRLQSFAMGN